MKRDDEPSIADEIPHNPTRLRCAAHNCCLAGALADSSRSTSWWCAYHFGVHPDDLPRVSWVLNENHELLDAVLECRTAMADQHGQAKTFPARAKVLRQKLQHAGYSVPATDNLPELARWAEITLGGRVRDALRKRVESRRAA